VASLVVISALVEVPQGVRIVLGVPVVFAIPGFVALSVAGPTLQLSWAESVLASLGISVAMATCVAVLLAAMPIGLSRSSFAIALGGITMVGSIYALAKARLWSDWRRRSRKWQAGSDCEFS
jgi:uncharacterized membrane protein